MEQIVSHRTSRAVSRWILFIIRQLLFNALVCHASRRYVLYRIIIILDQVFKFLSWLNWRKLLGREEEEKSEKWKNGIISKEEHTRREILFYFPIFVAFLWHFQNLYEFIRIYTNMFRSPKQISVIIGEFSPEKSEEGTTPGMAIFRFFCRLLRYQLETGIYLYIDWLDYFELYWAYERNTGYI